jgi:Rieske Fe-S protein
LWFFTHDVFNEDKEALMRGKVTIRSNWDKEKFLFCLCLESAYDRYGAVIQVYCDEQSLPHFL